MPARLADLSQLAFATVDEALEWSEERVLSSLNPEGRPGSTVMVADSDLGRGLDVTEAAALAQAGRMMRIARGSSVVPEGAAAQSMYLVTSGHLTASIDDRRVASFGPGRGPMRRADTLSSPTSMPSRRRSGNGSTATSQW